MNHLPATIEEVRTRGWDAPDIILVSGDAYVDHPSFGIAVIGRVLEKAGYRVAILAQPDWRNPESITVLGKPRYFFGVTAGNVDSMLAHYTAFGKVRNDDPYSPGGKAGLRPNRATIVYCNLIRAAFKGVPIIIGGIEASMRRLAHYDFWDNAVRSRSSWILGRIFLFMGWEKMRLQKQRAVFQGVRAQIRLQVLWKFPKRYLTM